MTVEERLTIIEQDIVDIKEAISTMGGGIDCRPHQFGTRMDCKTNQRAENSGR